MVRLLLFLLTLPAFAQNVTLDGSLGIGQQFPLAPLHIGNASIPGAADAQALVARNVGGFGPSGHAFADYSLVDRSGSGNGIGYNSFDSLPKFIGSQNYNHMSSFQARPEIYTTGRTETIYGLMTAPLIYNGTVGTNYALYIDEPLGDGILERHYGLFVKYRGKAALSYSIYTEGGDHYLGGPTKVDGPLAIGNTLTVDGTNCTITMTVSGTAVKIPCQVVN